MPGASPGGFFPMLAYPIEPVTIDPVSEDQDAARCAFFGLAEAAKRYLGRLLSAADDQTLPRRAALITRVRGTGPGVSFGSLVEAMKAGLPIEWQSPFEGSRNVAGAVLEAARVLGEPRDDGFLFLRFEAGTLDLPLHIHEFSERFIYVLDGRGLYHVSPDPLHELAPERVRNVPVRARDVLMFSRGTVHTFSTTDEALTLLSYHQPFIPLESERQYRVSNPPLLPRDLLPAATSRVSFDAGWTCLA